MAVLPVQALCSSNTTPGERRGRPDSFGSIMRHGNSAGGVSGIYKILAEGKDLEVPTYIKNWEGNRTTRDEPRGRENYETGT